MKPASMRFHALTPASRVRVPAREASRQPFGQLSIDLGAPADGSLDAWDSWMRSLPRTPFPIRPRKAAA